jgi:type I restriction enzyme R subunit
LLLPILKERLIALNPGGITDDERAERVISRLRAERDNQEWLRWLRGEKTFKFAVDEQEQNINLMDFDDVEGNDFLATNQFRYGEQAPQLYYSNVFCGNFPRTAVT